MNLFTRMFAGVEEPRFPHNTAATAAPVGALIPDVRPLPIPKKADADRLELFLEGLKTVATEPRPRPQRGLAMGELRRGEVLEYIGRQNLYAPIAIEFGRADLYPITVLLRFENVEQLADWAPIFDIWKIDTPPPAHDVVRAEGRNRNWAGYDLTIYHSRWINPAWAHYAQLATEAKEAIA